MFPNFIYFLFSTLNSGTNSVTLCIRCKQFICENLDALVMGALIVMDAC